MNESRVELEKHVWDTFGKEVNSTKELSEQLFNMDTRINYLEQLVKELQKEKLDLKDLSNKVMEITTLNLNKIGNKINQFEG